MKQSRLISPEMIKDKLRDNDATHGKLTRQYDLRDDDGNSSKNKWQLPNETFQCREEQQGQGYGGGGHYGRNANNYTSFDLKNEKDWNDNQDKKGSEGNFNTRTFPKIQRRGNRAVTTCSSKQKQYLSTSDLAALQLPDNITVNDFSNYIDT